MIRKGKSSGHEGADPIESRRFGGGEGRSDSQIVNALQTSTTTVYRTRQQLVEEGFEAVLSRKNHRGLRCRRFLTMRRKPN